VNNNLAEITVEASQRISTESVFVEYLNGFLKDVELGLEYNLDSIERLVTQGFLTSLCNKLENVGQQTVLLELRAMASLQFGLTDADARRKLIKDKEWPRRMVRVYPELARLLKVISESYARNCIEFCCRLKSDFNDVCTQFGLKYQYSDIDLIELGSAETHSQHRSVVKLCCNGEPVVGYKPRSLALEATVTEFIEAAMNVSGPPYSGLLTPTAIDKGMYGWVRWLPQKEAASESEVKTYFKRLGFLTALLTALRVPDLHSGNLIAHGDSPVFIDLETAFSHTPVKEVDGVPLAPEIHWNCQETGLLPLWIWKGADMVGVDLSGIGALTPQYVSMPFYQLTDDAEPDQNTFKQRGVQLYPGANILRMNGETQLPWNYSVELEKGMLNGFRFLKSHKNDLLELCAETSNLVNRLITKPTSGYHYVTLCSYHPRFMQNSALRREFIESSISVGRVIDVAVDVEIEACFNGDVPRFESTPTSFTFRDIGYGGENILPDGTYTSGRTNVENYVNSDLDSRLQFERRLLVGGVSSLSLFYKNSDTLKSKNHKFRDEDISRSLTVDDCFEGVSANVRTLELFLREGEVVPGYWYGFRASGASAEFGLLGSDFYSGMGGIIYSAHLLCTSIADHKGKEIDRLVDVLSETLLRELRDPEIKLGGAYSGTISSLPLCAKMLSKRSPLSFAQFGRHSGELVMAKLLDEQLRAGIEADLMTGDAGLVAVCGNMYKLTRDEIWLDATNRAIDSLFARKQEAAGYTIFPTNSAVSYHPDACLTGLSHGQIGVAVGLATAKDLLEGWRKDKVCALIENLIKWEMNHFEPDVSNWFDFRKRSPQRKDGESAWSHGFPGIYLALSYLTEVKFETARKFIDEHPFEQAVVALLERKYRLVDDSLCQGSLGVALIAKRFIDRNGSLMDELLTWLRLSHFVELRQRPLRVNQVDIPGFWIGTAGGAIGFGELAGINGLRTPLLPHEITENM